MRSTSGTTHFAPQGKDNPQLVIQNPNKPVSLHQSSGNQPFSSYVRLSGQGQFETDPTALTGTNSEYGFDIYLRSASCEGGDLCDVGGAGNLLLRLDTKNKQLHCAYVEGQIDHVSTTMDFDPSKETLAGCLVQGTQVRMYVDGVSTPGTRPSTPLTLVRARMGFGVPDGSSGGKLRAEIGQFRYWNDFQAMDTAHLKSP